MGMPDVGHARGVKRFKKQVKSSSSEATGEAQGEQRPELREGSSGRSAQRPVAHRSNWEGLCGPSVFSWASPARTALETLHQPGGRDLLHCAGPG